MISDFYYTIIMAKRIHSNNIIVISSNIFGEKIVIIQIIYFVKGGNQHYGAILQSVL